MFSHHCNLAWAASQWRFTIASCRRKLALILQCPVSTAGRTGQNGAARSHGGSALMRQEVRALPAHGLATKAPRGRNRFLATPTPHRLWVDGVPTGNKV